MKILFNREYGIGFVNAIKDKIIRDIKLSINIAKLTYIDNYLQNELLLDYSAIDIIRFSLKHFIIITFDDKFILKIDENIIYKDNIKLIDLVNMINYGNLELKPHPIYSEAFNNVVKNVNDLYKMYKRIGMTI